MRKIGIYCRVSTDEQARNKEGSITSQVQRLKLKVEEKNRYDNDKWGKLVEVYKDEAFSGKNTDRPEFQRMMQDIRKKRVDTIIVTELSRLSRSVTDFLNFINDLEALECDFICLQYDFDTTSPAGKVFMTIIMALAQFERELTAERIRNNFHARALRGLSNGGHPALGLNRDPQNPGHLVVCPKEAEVVKEIYQLFLDTGKISEVINTLNQSGRKNKSWITKQGQKKGDQPFDRNSVSRILSNPIYIGKREINKGNKKKSTEMLRPDERFTLVDASWDAIIDEETFKRIQSSLNENKNLKSCNNHDFIFSGFLKCDECGRSLFGQSANGRSQKHFYYGHKTKGDCKINRYSAPEIESVVKKQLFSLLNNQALKEEFIEVVKELANKRPQSQRSLLAIKDKEIHMLQLEVDKWIKIMSSSSEAAQLDAVIKKVKETETRLKNIIAERASLAFENEFDTLRNIDSTFIQENLDQLRADGFRKANISKKREIVKSVIKSITIHPDNVIKIDIWGSEASVGIKNNDEGAKGVVLPFLKMGRPLESSFKTAFFGGEKYFEVKMANNLGITVNAGGSSSFCNGGR